jgi:hypothetical protein
LNGRKGILRCKAASDQATHNSKRLAEIQLRLGTIAITRQGVFAVWNPQMAAAPQYRSDRLADGGSAAGHLLRFGRTAASGRKGPPGSASAFLPRPVPRFPEACNTRVRAGSPRQFAEEHFRSASSLSSAAVAHLLALKNACRLPMRHMCIT